MVTSESDCFDLNLVLRSEKAIEVSALNVADAFIAGTYLDVVQS